MLCSLANCRNDGPSGGRGGRGGLRGAATGRMCGGGRGLGGQHRGRLARRRDGHAVGCRSERLRPRAQPTPDRGQCARRHVRVDDGPAELGDHRLDKGVLMPEQPSSARRCRRRPLWRRQPRRRLRLPLFRRARQRPSPPLQGSGSVFPGQAPRRATGRRLFRAVPVVPTSTPGASRLLPFRVTVNRLSNALRGCRSESRAS